MAVRLPRTAEDPAAPAAGAGSGGRALILDNFDSFTWNVAHGLAAAGLEVLVRRVDRIDLDGIRDAAPTLLVISPGPGRPEDATLSLDALRAFAGLVPILGICLGLQCMAVAFGGAVGRAPAPVHGKVSPASHDGRGIFSGLPSPLEVARYHSLALSAMPAGFHACATSLDDGVVMAIRHSSLPLAALQFHPDSFLTPAGGDMLANAARGLL